MKKSRLENFSDAVFAIALTLLVLTLRPNLSLHGSRAMILAEVPAILVYVLSFVVIDTYWVAHHSMLYYIAKVNRTLLWLDLALLLVVTFIPYPTALIGANHGDLGSVRLYGLTLILANFFGTVLWLYGTRPPLALPGVTAGQRRRVAITHAAPMLVYACAIAVAPRIEAFTFALYAAVPIIFMLGGDLLERWIKIPAEPSH